MPSTSISAELSQQDAVMNAIATIKAKLPFLVDLSTDDRKTLPKMGDKSCAFVSKAMGRLFNSAGGAAEHQIHQTG